MESIDRQHEEWLEQMQSLISLLKIRKIGNMMIGQQQKDQAEKWFKDLRDRICEEFEILEEDHLKLAPKSDVAAKKFER